MYKRAAVQTDTCTADDYQKMFAANAGRFEKLCWALTGDEQLAHESLATAFAQALESASQVFRVDAELGATPHHQILYRSDGAANPKRGSQPFIACKLSINFGCYDFTASIPGECRSLL